MHRTIVLFASLSFPATAATAAADVVEFDFQGNAGFGLLPGNSVGPGTPTGDGVGTPAFGNEQDLGLLYDTDTNELRFDFQFSSLTDGLADVASGIHFHIIDNPTDPFNQTGPIGFNLNSGADPNVTLDTPLIPVDGTVDAGTVAGVATLTEDQEALLFAGAFYLNLHSAQFGAGEIRGNLVVPAPASAGLLGLGGLAVVGRRRR